MSFIAELKRRKVFRVAAAYLVAAWLLIQIVETVFPAFGLDNESFRILVIALAIGIVPVVVLAWAFELTRSGLQLDRPADDDIPVEARQKDTPPSFLSLLRYRRFSVPILILLVVILGAAALIVPRVINARWARFEAIPEIFALVEKDSFESAYDLAVTVEQYIPDDPVLADLWQTFAVQQSIETQPTDAQAFYKEYSTPDAEWKALGPTPIESVRLPRTTVQWKFQKEGFSTTHRSRESFDGTLTVEIAEATSSANSINVPGKKLFFLLTGFSDAERSIPDFDIDQYEVTNREFLDFVEQGGYENPAYWDDLEFARDGRTLSFDEAIAYFQDPTGRAGPATWKGGAIPAGEEILPVRGVSWFEAAAYAEFRGKELPSIYHWSAAAVFPPDEEVQLDYPQETINGGLRARMMSRSNFSGDGAIAVGSLQNPGAYGTYDMAGNVREWCWNATADAAGSDRYILGGSWEDPSYLFTYAIAESPWDRSATNGFRLASYVAQTDAIASLRAPVPRPVREQNPPVPDEIFQVYRNFYDYDRTELNARIESIDSESPYWIRETVSFDATYGGERIIAHLFLPRNVEPPYQVVAYFPSSNAIRQSSSDTLELFVSDFIVMSGRALVFPVIHGTYERNIGLETTWPTHTRAYSDHVLRWIQDFRRTIDYVETREEFDLDQLGYYGWSWGGWNGPIVMSLDDRFKAGVYVSGGIPPTLARPEASSASFASRVSAPVLMISGEHDVLRPVETFQKPMFESLGTPVNLKRHAILDGGHVPPMNQLVSETLGWFDQHLGPVEQ